MRLPRTDPINPTLAREPFDDPQWVFELKHDGFRAITYISRGKCDLVSRRRNAYKSFGPLKDTFGALRVRNAILDGEIVCLDGSGRSQFKELLYRRGDPAFYAFDLVWLDGRDLRHLPLIQRKAMLRDLPGRQEYRRILCADHVETRGRDLFRAVCAQDLEGIVAKRKADPYGATAAWLKIRNPNYTQKEGRREIFESFRDPARRTARVNQS